MKNDFTLAFNEVIEEKQLPKEIILKALESAMVSAYRRAVNASSAQSVEATINPETGKVTIYAEKEVVESVQDDRTEVSLEEAHRFNPEAELGSMVIVESTPKDFGRVAAQTARQVIQQRIRDAERQAQLAYYEKQVGEIVSGIVQAVNAQGLTIGMEMRAEGSMSRKDMINGERFRIHDRVRALIAEVKDSPRGPQIILSRTHRDFLRRLLENEVPEIYHGVVEIRSIAREPGERAKVAVSATQAGIDPVGACVGIRGVRIQAIVRELHEEKIDVIEWNSDPSQFIAKAISPARVAGVYLNERSANGKTATVVVPEDQLSLAIGRDGQNARLAAKLTNWRIDIKSVSEAAADALHHLETDTALAEQLQIEAETLEKTSSLLAKKADGRSLTPEDYDALTKFVDQVERRTAQRRTIEKKAAEDAIIAELRKTIPARVFERNIIDSGLPDHVAFTLQENGFTTIGELVIQMKQRPDDILRLQGIGPRAMNEISNLIENLASLAENEPVEETPAVVAEVSAPETVVEEPIAIVETVEPEAVSTAVDITPIVDVEPAFEEEEKPFHEFIKLDIATPVDDIEEEEVSSDKEKKGKKKKKGKHVEVEYDPDRDMTFVTKKHKRGEDGDWNW